MKIPLDGHVAKLAQGKNIVPFRLGWIIPERSPSLSRALDKERNGTNPRWTLAVLLDAPVLDAHKEWNRANLYDKTSRHKTAAPHQVFVSIHSIREALLKSLTQRLLC